LHVGASELSLQPQSAGLVAHWPPTGGGADVGGSGCFGSTGADELEDDDEDEDGVGSDDDEDPKEEDSNSDMTDSRFCASDAR
jgi:hypothetical protein